jgi:hypothetical protein
MYTLVTALFSKTYFRVDLAERIVLSEVFAQRERKKTYVNCCCVY